MGETFHDGNFASSSTPPLDETYGTGRILKGPFVYFIVILRMCVRVCVCVSALLDISSLFGCFF